MKLSNKEECVNHIKSMNIDLKLYEHDACANMDEMVKNVPLEHAPFIKNLFYYDKKNNFYIVMAKNETKVGKKFWKTLGLSPGNIRLAREDHLTEILGVKLFIQVTKGTVNPFASINDENRKIAKIIFDKDLEQNDYVAFHPMDNKATVELKRKDLEKYIE